MLPVRIFVSYIAVGDPHGTEIARRLIGDLQAVGAEIVTAPRSISDHADLPFLTRKFIPFLSHELAACQYLILIQTPATLHSPWVQTTFQVALNSLDRQHILRFIAVSSAFEEPDRFWETLRTFDASQDYPRMREKLLVELGLISLDSEMDASSPDKLLASDQSALPTAVPASSRGSLRGEQAKPDLLPFSRQPAPGPGFDRPAPLRKHPTFWVFKGLSPFAGIQPTRRLVDHPLPAHRKPFLHWKTMLSICLAAILVLTGGFFFFNKLAAFRTTSVSRPLTRPTSVSVATRPVSTGPTSNILAQDTFQRPDQQGWGTASDGHLWGADATNQTLFSIQQEHGIIQGGQGPLNATLGQPTTNAEILFTGSISLFTNANFGALLRWVNPTTFYKAYLDGQNLILLKNSGGHMTTLVSVPFPATANVFYDIRFRAQGTTLSARAWPANSPEPTQWMITAQDQTIQGGSGGLRVVTAPGVTITITAFQESIVA